jgi:hypothetical protein
MTLGEIRDWALAHGFEEDRGSVLSARVDGGRVEVEILSRNVRVSSVIDGERRTIVSADPKRAFVNEHDVVEGLGLSTSFAMGRYGSCPGRTAPPWMSQDYLDAIGWEGAPAVASPAPR